MPFPTAKDYHKPGQPPVPNCYGIFYALISVCYWFILYALMSIYPSSLPGVTREDALALATSVLFGSTMGLFDDMADLKWRYKAILPVFASLPFMVLQPSDRRTILLLFLGVVDLGTLFFLLAVPLIVTVTTNTYNQLGGLNGLESLSGLIVLAGLTAASLIGTGTSIPFGKFALTLVPMLTLLALGYLNYRGKIFLGNVGTFSIGLTLAVYAILMNLKFFLFVSLLPFMFNSVLILFSNYIFHERADTLLDENGLLYSNKPRSLRTLILHHKRLSERQAVLTICALITLFAALAMLQHIF